MIESVNPNTNNLAKAHMPAKRKADLRSDVIALKRDRILYEAAKLFFEHGYLQTTVDAIVDRLGATKPFLYYHFKSKVDLLVEICVRGTSDALAAMDSRVLGEGSPTERLERLVRGFTNAALKNHEFTAIYFREDMNLPKAAADRINKMRRSMDRRLRSLLKEGVASGDFELDDPHISALVIAGMISYAFAWYREGRRLEQEEVTELIVKMVLKMVRATAATTVSASG